MRLGADSPDERGTTESGGLGSGPEVEVFAGRLGSGPEVEVFAGKNFTLGSDPGASLWGQTRDYLVMARMKVAREVTMEVMEKRMLVEELKKALRASAFLGST